ncbi:MAG: apolipoprotein N-acyltransferase [Rhodospirillaceae bacterium]|nr:apolipoprotein N-acyltransferase [Rhodospirillaceae bacterium]
MPKAETAHRQTLTGLPARLAGLTGWRRVLLLSLLGAGAAVALPPFHVLLLLIVAFVPLFWMIEAAARIRGAFWTGFWFALGHFTFGLYWIAHSMLLDPLRFGWMIPFAVCGLAALLGLFVGAAAAITRAWPWPGASRAIVFAIAWVVAEWGRSWVMGGFPWNLIAYSWAAIDEMMQPAALVGAYGLGFVTVLAATMPATIASADARVALGRRLRPTLFAAALLALAGGFGIWRLAGADIVMVPDVTLRIVQPGIPQTLKNDPAARQANFERHRTLTLETPGFERITHVLWPEASVPYLIEREPGIGAFLASAVPPGGYLLAGAVRGEPDSGTIERIFNGLSAIDPNGVRVATGDKFHLVPFGEYVPLRAWFPFIAKVTPGSLDFTPGPGPVTVRLPGLPAFSPLICYEVIFAGDVVDDTDRPDWLLNLTNDGWFGISTGPHQHFAAARFRAVEEGLPLVRAANTGISGVVDAWGRIVLRTGLGDEAVVDSGLPTALPATPYARWANLAPVLLLLAALVVATLGARRH